MNPGAVSLVIMEILFNSFLNNYLRIFYTGFPPHKINEKSNNNSWITPCIRISCRRRRCLYLLTSDSDNVILKNYYKQYCKNLRQKGICITIESLTLPIKWRQLGILQKQKQTKRTLQIQLLTTIKTLLRLLINISHQ